MPNRYEYILIIIFGDLIVYLQLLDDDSNNFQKSLNSIEQQEQQQQQQQSTAPFQTSPNSTISNPSEQVLSSFNVRFIHQYLPIDNLFNTIFLYSLFIRQLKTSYQPHHQYYHHRILFIYHQKKLDLFQNH